LLNSSSNRASPPAERTSTNAGTAGVFSFGARGGFACSRFALLSLHVRPPGPTRTPRPHPGQRRASPNGYVLRKRLHSAGAI
jgi:hypothetical protein